MCDLGRQILLFEILPSNALPNCEVLRIDPCFRLYFVLSCFIQFVLLQLLIKLNTCVNEMSSKHLPHYGFCYVRSNEWEPVFLVQKRKTARIKDVNKSQEKCIANLSSLACLYFYYMVLSRSFLEMFFFKKKILLLVRIQLKRTQSQQRDCYWSSVPGEQPLDFCFHSETFLPDAVQHTDRTWLWFCALGHASQETGGPEVSGG